MVQKVRASIVLAVIDAAGLFDTTADRVIAVPVVEKAATVIADDYFLGVVNAKDAAYVMYTSGSTGTPERVVIEHRALRTNVKHLGAAFGFCTTLRVYQFSPYTFDAAIMNIFIILVARGCVCILSEDQRTSNVKAMNRMTATLAILTPSIGRKIDPDSLETLETLILGGDAVGHSDVA